MTRILERAGFALVLLFAVVAANSVAIMLSANAQAHRAFVASPSSRQGVSPVPASIAFAGGHRA